MVPDLLSGFAQSRRTRLLRLLQPLQASSGASPVLLPAGRARPRNYLANPYPFRASSHFLYFVGRAIEGAALWLDRGLARLVLDPADPDDALWHGPVPTREELARVTGLELLTWDELESLRQGRAVATVPCLDRGEAERLAPRLGREATRLGHEELDGPLLDAIVSLRLQHDAGALRELRRAADVSVRAHQAGMRATRPSLIERDICAAMEHELARAGFSTAYGSIVSVHGEVLHNHRHDNVLRTGDLLLADVGAESDTGYASDITRTWPVSGRFSPTQRVMYELVWAMQRDAIAALRPGARFRDVHLVAARTLLDGLVQLGIFEGQVDALLEDGAHALFFPHGVGHLLGLDVHDMEDLGDRAGYAPGRSRSSQFGLGYLRLDRDLAAGMVVTIEPGFYQVPSLLADPERLGLSSRALHRSRLAAFEDVRGIRIEDDVLITDAGSEVLTHALATAPDEVEALVLTFY
ncbi:MAG: Xaa-Pro aminopeptidase [Myxococcaceae bacterium]|nr:Xaa-Pro aminopeptidase [Myxococcaceae bacterium]